MTIINFWAGFVRPFADIFRRSHAVAILMFFFVLLVMGGCKEDDHHHHDGPYEVDITFLEPTDSVAIISGDELHMEVLFTSAGTIHNVKVRILRASDSAEVYLYEEHVHEESGSFEFHDHLTLTSSDHEEFTIEASTWDQDGEDDPIVLTRTFQLQP